ncbi:hypothetical protein [Shouchella patagoniensis]|uniref:hypothetical protein n=1 Tax=Shouchella patagoniensis TaxID=228576 RepID=UPI0009954C7C|nr:hypothetical protein [Shouchella patagoniensis]
MKRRIVLVAVCVGIAIAIMLKVGNDNRQRNLAELIPFNKEDLLLLGITVERDNVEKENGYEWYTTEPALVEEVVSFLGEYQVKRVDTDVYHQQFIEEKPLELYISHQKSKPSIVFLGETGVMIIGTSGFELLNGPLEVEWFQEFIEENEGEEM